jgi:hypothetical protein
VTVKNFNILNSSSSMCHSVMCRSFRPYLHPDFLFKMSAIGKQQKRSLDILHSMTKRVIESKKKEHQTAGSRYVTFEDNEDTGKCVLKVTICR